VPRIPSGEREYKTLEVRPSVLGVLENTGDMLLAMLFLRFSGDNLILDIVCQENESESDGVVRGRHDFPFESVVGVFGS
jgi:hypothetical protein